MRLTPPCRETAGKRPARRYRVCEIVKVWRATSGLRSALHDLRHEKERPFLEALASLVELERRLAPERQTVLVIEEGFPEELPSEVGVELLRVLREASDATLGRGW